MKTKRTIIEINSCNSGSTGYIMNEIANAARENDYVCYTSSPVRRKNNKPKDDYHVYFDSLVIKKIHIILGKITGFAGCFSIVDTLVFLRKLKKIEPDIIHLHNLHSSFLCLPLLFRFIKKRGISVVWTLHDCWAFTGRCPHFQISKCEGWKNGCIKCHYPRKDYPSTYLNPAHSMWKLKRAWFCGMKKTIIVTPSTWLMQLVKESYLKEYKVKVINNGIDLDIFQPTESTFRNRYGINEDKFVVLGVASPWSRKKGIDVFIDLAGILGQKYQIVLVGIEAEDHLGLPESIIPIQRIADPKELAEIYTASDVFVNPTREEVLGLVNIEALACGIPVVTFDSGGSPECIDETCGFVVAKDDINTLYKRIIYICENKPFSKDACIKRARRFDSKCLFQKYIDVYTEVIDTNQR